MIEQLESRALFSTTPHAALTLLRADVAGIGLKFKTLTIANKAAIANLQSDMSIFPTHDTTDNAALRQLNFQFNSQLATLVNNYNSIKALLGQDIAQLITSCNAYNHHPTASAGLSVQASQQLLSSQASTASATLAQDCSQMQHNYLLALTLISQSHPIDVTLVTRVSHIANAFASNLTTIQSIASTIAVTDVPNFITALEPAGIITTAPAAVA